MAQKISDHLLEQYLLRELPAQRLAELERLIQADPKLKQRLGKLQRSNAEILKRYPPRIMSAKIRQRARQAESETSRIARAGNEAFTRWALPAFSLAAAAVLLLFLVPGLPLTDGLKKISWVETTRLKGAQTSLCIYRKTPSGAETLTPNSLVQKGDLLQIGYATFSDPYGVILSFDGRGTITLHFPANVHDRPLLKFRHKTLLSAAYELDDAPSFERFFLVTSRSEFSVAEVREAARLLALDRRKAAKGRLSLPDSLHQISILILKKE